jgi:hypothetical protein
MLGALTTDDYHVFLHPEFVFWSVKDNDFMATICQHCVAFMTSKMQAPPFSAKNIDFRDWHRYPGYVELSDSEMLVIIITIIVIIIIIITV